MKKIKANKVKFYIVKRKKPESQKPEVPNR